MKKLLIATTALVATAGVAAADVSVGGNGRMGVVYNGEDLNFSSRLRIAFTASGETDGGLSFGGSIRADNAGGGANGSAGNVFISGAFGKIAMGDVVGAAEAVIGDLPEVGYTDISANDITYITGDGRWTSARQPGHAVHLHRWRPDVRAVDERRQGYDRRPPGIRSRCEVCVR
jgi:outer membrane protein OmpU